MPGLSIATDQLGRPRTGEWLQSEGRCYRSLYTVSRNAGSDWISQPLFTLFHRGVSDISEWTCGGEMMLHEAACVDVPRRRVDRHACN